MIASGAGAWPFARPFVFAGDGARDCAHGSRRCTRLGSCPGCFVCVLVAARYRRGQERAGWAWKRRRRVTKRQPLQDVLRLGRAAVGFRSKHRGSWWSRDDGVTLRCGRRASDWRQQGMRKIPQLHRPLDMTASHIQFCRTEPHCCLACFIVSCYLCPLACLLVAVQCLSTVSPRLCLSPVPDLEDLLDLQLTMHLIVMHPSPADGSLFLAAAIAHQSRLSRNKNQPDASQPPRFIRSSQNVRRYVISRAACTPAVEETARRAPCAIAVSVPVRRAALTR